MLKNLAIAVDLGATNVRVALIFKKGKILKKIKEKTKKKGISGKIITNQIIRMIKSLIKEESLLKIAGIGVSSIGPLDYKKGGIDNAPNIPFKFISIIKPLKETFSLPVFLLNDCKAAVFGEKFFGLGKNIQNLVYVTISTGIGGGAIIDGNLLLGEDGNASEIGHLIIGTDFDFLYGYKKGKHYWEHYASGKNLPQFFSFWLKNKNINSDLKFSQAKNIFEAAKKKNKIVLEFLDEVGRINAAAISNIIVTYNPKLIILGGSVVLNNPDMILKPIKMYVDRYLTTPEIKITSLKEDVTLFGAGACVFWPPKFIKPY